MEQGKKLIKDYKWAVDMITKAFPKFEVISALKDYRSAYVVMVDNQKEGNEQLRYMILLHSTGWWETTFILNKQDNPKQQLQAKIEDAKEFMGA